MICSSVTNRNFDLNFGDNDGAISPIPFLISGGATFGLWVKDDEQKDNTTFFALLFAE